MMKGFFDTLPRELEQAAKIDGCNELQALWLVILPLARPGLAACGIYLAIVAWSEFVFARTLVTKPDELAGHRRPAVVRRRIPRRMAGADGGRRRVAAADVRAVPAARAVPRERHDVGCGQAVVPTSHRHDVVPQLGTRRDPESGTLGESKKPAAHRIDVSTKRRLPSNTECWYSW